MTGTSRPRAAGRWVVGIRVGVWCVVLALVIGAPVLGRGFVLSYDMVAVPDLRLVPSSWGGGSALPRAVPQDAVVAVLDTIVPGELLQKLVLLGVLIGAGLGMAVLLGRAGRGPGPQAVGAAVYVWNPFVAERLVLGHWALLICYACLPWLIDAARRLRAGEGSRAASAVVLLVALSSVSATGGLIATAVAVAMVAIPGGRHRRSARISVIIGALVLQAPWVVPALASATPATSDPAGVEAFAARADSPLGLVGSVLTLGGIWNGDVVPTSRSLVSAAVLSVAILAVAAFGLAGLTRTIGRASTTTVVVLGASGVTIALVGAVAPSLVEWVVAEIPGGGLLRDGQKFLAAVYALLVAVAAAVGAERLAGRAAPGQVVTRGPYVPWIPAGVVMATAAVLPIAALPDLGWGVAGRLDATAYPREWAQARTVLDREPAGDVVVLPFQPFRSFTWTDGRVVLDPAPRYFGRETVMPGDLVVRGRTVRGEDVRAEQVGAALAAADITELAELGVGYVLVERDTPGDVPDDLLAALDPVVITDVVEIHRVPGPVAPWPLSVSVGVAAGAHAAALAVLLGAAGIRLVGRGRSGRMPTRRGRPRLGGASEPVDC